MDDYLLLCTCEFIHLSLPLAHATWVASSWGKTREAIPPVFGTEGCPAYSPPELKFRLVARVVRSTPLFGFQNYCQTTMFQVYTLI